VGGRKLNFPAEIPHGSRPGPYSLSLSVSTPSRICPALPSHSGLLRRHLLPTSDRIPIVREGRGPVLSHVSSPKVRVAAIRKTVSQKTTLSLCCLQPHKVTIVDVRQKDLCVGEGLKSYHMQPPVINRVTGGRVFSARPYKEQDFSLCTPNICRCSIR